MATTQLSDVVIPEVYADYQAVNNPKKTAFYQSGIIVNNEMLDQKADTGGDSIDVPFWHDLDPNDEPNISNSDPTDEATPLKITAGKQIAAIAYLNQGYSSADLSAEMAGSDPMNRIRERFGRYWQWQHQKRLVASVQGIIADNVANDNSDMVHDVSNDTTPQYYSRQAFIEAAFTLGDQFEEVQAIAVHSGVYQQMIENDDIAFIPDSEGTLTIPTYMGRRVIVDDGLPVDTAGTNPKYTTALFGAGAFGYGEGTPRTPVEIDRNAAAGHGGGIEMLWERRTWVIHPFGFQYTASNTNAVPSSSLAELRKKATWKRVVPYRKQVPMAFLITN